MAVDLGKNLISSFLRLGEPRGVQTARATAVSAPKAYKTAGYASIPYEKAPKALDTVPTKYADGTPFWADYSTPNHVWVA